MPTATVSAPVERFVAEITGHVQGVGYRYFARAAARQLGVAGFVRNDPDGVVTVAAEGPRRALDALLARLGEGPPLAEVDDVDVHWETPTGRYKAFSVEV